jgi:hypothetical protein
VVEGLPDRLGTAHLPRVRQAVQPGGGGRAEGVPEGVAVLRALLLDSGQSKTYQCLGRFPQGVVQGDAGRLDAVLAGNVEDVGHLDAVLVVGTPGGQVERLGDLPHRHAHDVVRVRRDGQFDVAPVLPGQVPGQPVSFRSVRWPAG